MPSAVPMDREEGLEASDASDSPLHCLLQLLPCISKGKSSASRQGMP